MIHSSNNGGKKDMDVPPQDPKYGGSGDIFVSPDGRLKRPEGPKTVEEFEDVRKQGNWISYGFDTVDMKEDRLQTKIAMFCIVTLCMVTSGYILWYYPDVTYDNWAEREAYLELYRRKKRGQQPLISMDYADPKHFELPDEEEIGDQAIYL
jgi:hypothetical protein